MCPASSTASSERRLVPVSKLPARTLAGETVLVNPRLRRVFVMNTVGGVVWSGVARGASAGEIVAEVVARFRVDAEQAGRDVARFFDELQSAGLAAPAPENG